jgi:hypothetical protein
VTPTLQILSCIKALKELRLVFVDTKFFERTRPPVTEYGAQALHYPTLVEAIMMHGESLERLAVHNDSSTVPKLYYATIPGCLHLRQLSNLRYLSTDVQILYLDETADSKRQYEFFETLPPNIRRLDLDMHEPLWPYFTYPKPVLKAFAKECAHTHPLLKEIGIVKYCGSKHGFQSGFREIEDVFNTQGVTVTFCERQARLT